MSLNILVVDDCDLFTHSLGTVLAMKLKATIYTANTVQDALAILDKPPVEFDAIVSDWRFDTADPDAVTGRLRHGASFLHRVWAAHHIPVIVVTGVHTDVLEADAKSLGALAVFAKPVPLDELFSILLGLQD